MADGNTEAIPRAQFQRERDHNNGTAIQSFKIDDKIFRENSGDSDWSALRHIKPGGSDRHGVSKGP